MGEAVRAAHSRCRLVITAFGPFSGVENNPSQAVLQVLPAELERVSSDLAEAVLECSVLRVAAKDVEEWLDHRAAAVEQSGAEKLHFGLDTHSSCFKLESKAANEAAFRCPDERGWQVEGKKIREEGEDFLLTDLDVQALKEKLEGQHEVALSDDAGRFVCNYIYYASLSKSRKNVAWHSLFVHVPPLDSKSKEQQLAFYVDLIRAIYDGV